MERIRIKKRKKNNGSGYIWGILIAIVLIGIAAWFLIDQEIIDVEKLSLNRNSAETENNEAYGETDESEDFQEYQEPEEFQGNSGSDVVKSYVSFVNREVVPAENIENQMKQRAITLLQNAVNEIEGNSGSGQMNDTGTGDRFADLQDSTGSEGLFSEEQTGSDSSQQRFNEENTQDPVYSLIDTGNQLLDIQEREYPSLSTMGKALNSTIDNLENSGEEQTEELKEFFIATSSLLQEIDSERNELSYN